MTFKLEQVFFMFMNYMIIPFAFLNHLIKTPTLRLYYSLFLGVSFQYIIYGTGIIHTFTSTIITYIFIKFYGRKKSAFIIFIITLIHLTTLHIYRMIVDYGGWTIDDPTTIYMMSICKFSSLAFCYEDGDKKDSELKTDYQKKYKIVEAPSLVEIFSYIYFYPTSIVGPSIEYKDFIDFINLKNSYSDLPMNYLVNHGVQYLFLSVATTVVYTVGTSKFPLTFVGDVAFGSKGFLYKYIYLFLSSFFARSKYYTGWTLSYASLIFSGIAYEEKRNDKGEVEERSLPKGDYGSIISSELGINPKTKLNLWNLTVHLWLKNYLFRRVVAVDKKPFKGNYALGSFLTFLVSAIWHGYYPTYYIMFTLFFFYQSGNEVLDKIGFFKYAEKNIPLTILMVIVSQTLFNGLGAIFLNLQLNLAIQFLINMKFVPIIGIALMYSLKYVIKVPKKQKTQ